MRRMIMLPSGVGIDMDRRQKNALIFEDTTKFVKESERLTEIVAKTKARQQLILEGEKIPDPGAPRDRQANVIVSGKRTLEAAGAYKGKKVCILNFASATNPGGGVVRGSSAQEESICRCSTLYYSLTTEELFNGFYGPHRNKRDPLYNEDLIYSPDVYVIKSDTDSPKRLQEQDWYKVNVITCAAPNLREKPSNMMNPNAGNKAAKISDQELESLLESRIRRIFAMAAAEKNDVLILGAFGCGAFRNPPKIVAKAFHKVLDEYREYFETVEFAVFHTDRETENFKAFREEFCILLEGYTSIF